MRNRFLWLSLAAVIALGTLAYTYTLQYAVTLDGKTTYYQKWGSGTISMAYNLTFPSQFASSNPNPSLVQAVIKNDMLNVWNSVLRPTRSTCNSPMVVRPPACRTPDATAST